MPLAVVPPFITLPTASCLSGNRFFFGTIVGLVIFLAGISPVSAESVADKSIQPLVSFLEKIPATSSAYVGDVACISCHQAKSDAYHQTAHARTSSLPSLESIHGKFNQGSNIFRTGNPDLFFVMESKENGFFQTGVLQTSPTTNVSRTERFDLVVGSGRKGQTYLYWNDHALFQLPVSYWVEKQEWVSSPGYSAGAIHFTRPIIPRCLECHASTFEALAPPKNIYNRDSVVLGISCEKCHGPGGEHVARYRSTTPPTSLAAAAIINPARLSRERQLDVCAFCHAGLGKSLTPPMSFIPGDVLARHLEIPKPDPKAPIDVHGSQVQMLERSRCFQSSPAMTCSTCHDVHLPQRNAAAMASSCLKCHTVESCRIFPKLGHAIDQQCNTCHMPLQETAQIVLSTINGQTLQPKVRNHVIGIYPDIRLP